MTVSSEVTTRLGSSWLVEVTNFDSDTDVTTINTDRRDAALADAEILIRQEAGLTEPSDTTTQEYAAFIALMTKGVRYYLLWYKEPEAQVTKNALQEFRDLAGFWRKRIYVPILTNSPVDTDDQDDDDRPARFAPNHWNDYRVGNSSSGTDSDEY